MKKREVSTHRTDLSSKSSKGRSLWMKVHRSLGMVSLFLGGVSLLAWWLDAGAAFAQEEGAKRARSGMIRQLSKAKPSKGSVFSAGQLPRYTPPMLNAPGHALVQAYCTTCHSTSYITMQPPFSSSIWRAEVNKMIHTYGAVIPKETAEKIISYLSKHYGPTSIAQTYAKIAAQRAHTSKTTIKVSKPAPNNAPPAWMAQAKQLYLQKCMACHQAHGGGLPGAFPPLAGHAHQFAETPARRAYMIRAVMYGLQGQIKVKGKDYFGMMPPLPPTSDKDLALILNYVTHAWGNQARKKVATSDFTPQEIKAQRGLSLTPLQVHGARKALGL